MSKNPHYADLESILSTYADSRSLDFFKFSPNHMRLTDGGYCVIDTWTTGRYYVLTTDYRAMEPTVKTIERGGEKGSLILGNGKDLDRKNTSAWLDQLFFAPNI